MVKLRYFAPHPMRNAIAIALLAATFIASAQSDGQPQRKQLTDAQREELRKKADALREKNAREREELQKGFRSEDSRSNAPPARTPLSQSRICKAAIAAIMERDPGIINIDSESGGVTVLSYRRPSDGTHWSNRCKVSGQSVIWASKDGRWRDHPLDEKISYELEGETLLIRQRYSTGFTVQSSFWLSSL